MVEFTMIFRPQTLVPSWPILRWQRRYCLAQLLEGKKKLFSFIDCGLKQVEKLTPKVPAVLSHIALKKKKQSSSQHRSGKKTFSFHRLWTWRNSLLIGELWGHYWLWTWNSATYWRCCLYYCLKSIAAIETNGFSLSVLSNATAVSLESWDSS